MICITDHWEDFEMECNPVALERLMMDLVPTEALAMLQKLREQCSNQATGYALRRNQRRRAVRSLQATEQLYEGLARDADYIEDIRETRKIVLDSLFVTENMAVLLHASCSKCARDWATPALTIRCLNCGAFIAPSAIRLSYPLLKTLAEAVQATMRRQWTITQM
jgi:hypothetical protein